MLFLAIPGCLIGGSGLAGAPGESSCAACHGASTMPLASQPGGMGVFLTFSGGGTYTPGVTQSVTVTVNDPAFPAFGYQASPRMQGQEMTQSGGTLIPVDASAQFYPASIYSQLNWIAAGESLTGEPTNTFHFKWTPPASGTVVFYVIGMGANGMGDPMPTEHVYGNTYTLTPAAAAPVVNQPAVAQGGVFSAAAKVPGLTSGGWVSIYGTNLSATTRPWSSDDLVGITMPTSLDGVTVTIDGKRAAISFISPSQLNVQVPDDTAVGPVPVVVTSGGVASEAVLANMAAQAPSFFTFDGVHVAGTHADNTPLSAAAAAAPGEVIVLYGTGFGATSPPAPAGVAVSSAHPLPSSASLRISIGGVPAEVAFAGMTAPGLFQFNVTVPGTLAGGDAAVVATISGAQTQDGAAIPVRQ